MPMHTLRLLLTWKVERGLERVYHQMERETADTIDTFLKDVEAEYRIREDADRERNPSENCKEQTQQESNGLLSRNVGRRGVHIVGDAWKGCFA